MLGPYRQPHREAYSTGGPLFKLSVMTFTASILEPLNHWVWQSHGA